MRRFIVCLLLIAGLVAVPLGNASAASDGPRSPSTAVEDTGVGTVAWADYGNVSASDDARATATITGGSADQTYYIKASSFGFSISAGATIDGIVVEVERRKTSPVGGSTAARDNSIRLMKGGGISGDNKANATDWPADTDAIASYGSSTDKWGLTWLASDINASDFGVAVSAKDFFSSADVKVEDDHIKITVHFTLAAPAMPRRQVIMGTAGRIADYTPTPAELFAPAHLAAAPGASRDERLRSGLSQVVFTSLIGSRLPQGTTTCIVDDRTGAEFQADESGDGSVALHVVGPHYPGPYTATGYSSVLSASGCRKTLAGNYLIQDGGNIRIDINLDACTNVASIWVLVTKGDGTQTHHYYHDENTLNSVCDGQLPNAAPSLSISMTPVSGSSPLRVQFSAVASDPDGSIQQIRWTFGDGASATHTYTVPRSKGYSVRCTVTDNSGASVTRTASIKVF